MYSRFASVSIRKSLFCRIRFFELILPNPLEIKRIQQIKTRRLRNLIQDFGDAIIRFPGTPAVYNVRSLGRGKIQLLHLRVIHLFVYAYKVVMNTEPFLYPDGIGNSQLCGIVQIEQRLHQLLIIVVHFFQRIARKAQDICHLR